jgi:hypothetical protein
MWPWNKKDPEPQGNPLVNESCVNCLRLAQRLAVLMRTVQKPMPCVMCGSHDIIGLGFWAPNEREKLAVGVQKGHESVIGFWVCREHAKMDESKPETQKAISQAITRLINERGIDGQSDYQ